MMNARSSQQRTDNRGRGVEKKMHSQNNRVEGIDVNISFCVVKQGRFRQSGRGGLADNTHTLYIRIPTYHMYICNFQISCIIHMYQYIVNVMCKAYELYNTPIMWRNP